MNYFITFFSELPSDVVPVGVAWRLESDPSIVLVQACPSALAVFDWLGVWCALASSDGRRHIEIVSLHCSQSHLYASMHPLLSLSCHE